MMNERIDLNFKTLLLSGLLLFALSCSKDLEDAVQAVDQEVTAAEVNTILETDQFSRAFDEAITDLFQQSGTAKSSKNDDCYDTDYSDTGFTLNFDNCTAEAGGEILNGSLSVVYSTAQETTAFTATFTDLSVDGIILNGTRSFTVLDGTGTSESVSLSIVSEMSITTADGAVVEESGTKIFSYDINFENSALNIAGDWTLKAEENTYTVTITSELIANFSCETVGKGIMAVAKNGLVVVVDFGNGTCDGVANMTYPDGTMEEISLKD